MILIYVVALVASDQKLITDPTVTRYSICKTLLHPRPTHMRNEAKALTLSLSLILCRHVTLILHSQFDSFSTFQWTGDEKKATEFLEGENSANDEQYNACGDVTEVFAQVPRMPFFLG